MYNNNNLTTTSKTDMTSLVQEAKDLFYQASTVTGEKAEALRDKGLALLDSATRKAHDIQVAAVDTGKKMAVATDDLVHENPWKAVAISAGVGLLLGILLSRK